MSKAYPTQNDLCIGKCEIDNRHTYSSNRKGQHLERGHETIPNITVGPGLLKFCVDGNSILPAPSSSMTKNRKIKFWLILFSACEPAILCVAKGRETQWIQKNIKDVNAENCQQNTANCSQKKPNLPISQGIQKNIGRVGAMKNNV